MQSVKENKAWLYEKMGEMCQISRSISDVMAANINEYRKKIAEAIHKSGGIDSQLTLQVTGQLGQKHLFIIFKDHLKTLNRNRLESMLNIIFNKD